ncbi:MAG: WYL domain-containing protein [Desulforhopalus sp.]|nr:WYL domain-containing protein [Desulforhopalus sp.]
MGLLERIFFFHQETHQGNFPNSRSLTANFEISIATAKRDIAYLRDRLLAPLAYDSVRNGYYYTDAGFHLPFEESPRIVFLLTMLSKLAKEAGLGELPEVKQLQQRLAAMISPEYEKLVESLSCQWIEVEAIDHRIFATIIEAVVKKRCLSLAYRPLGGATTTRTVAPMQLVNHQGRWYLFAFCSLRKANRLFHIARIKKATISRQGLPPDLPFDRNHLLQSFGIFQGPPRYIAEVLFTSTAAELVANQFWHKDQIITPVSEGVVVRLPVNDDRELLMKILQYGAMAKVLSPPELIQRLQSAIAAMAKVYS